MNKFIKFLYSSVVLISVMNFAVDPFLQPIVFLAMTAISFLIGFGRVSSYHPRFSKNYHNWLMMSPWNGNTLPKGTVILTVNDFIFQLLIFAVSYFTLPETFILLPNLAFLGGYNMALTMTLDKNVLFIPALLIPLCIILTLSVPMLLIPFSLLTVFNTCFFIKDRKELFKERKQTLKTIGSQINPLFPGREYLEINTVQKLLFAFIAFLWSFALITVLGGEESLVSYAETIFSFALIAAVLKYVFYLQISCSGFIYRIKHFILWDYKHDRILFAPLAIITSGFILSETLPYMGWPALAAIPISTFVIVIMVLFLGPTYKEWQLTGKLCLYKPSEIQMAGKKGKEIKITN